MKTGAVIFLVLSLSTTVVFAQEAVFDQREQNLVSGLRDRALFDLAEAHCVETLKRDGLTDTDYASIAIERIRIQSSRARTAQDREKHLRNVDQIAGEFFKSHQNNPRSVLVGLQQALAHVAFADLLQQEIEAKISTPVGRELGLRQLAQARTILDQTKENARATVRAQANQNLFADMLTGEQLRTLITNIEYQLAVVNLTSAQLSDSGTESGNLDRLDSLGRVPAQLAAVRNAVAESKPLWWKTWIKEATCRRMLGELSAADQILKKLKKNKRPKSIDSLLSREEIALLIAIGDRNRMKRLSGQMKTSPHDAETEVALIQLMIAAGEIEQASNLAASVAAKHGRWWARRADVALLSASGNKSAVKTTAVDSAGARMLIEAAEKAEKNGDLDAAFEGFRSVADSQFSAGDRSSALTTTVRAAMILEKQGKHAEAADVLLKPARLYAGENLAPSIHLRGCWNLSKSASERFREETTAHIRQWPDSDSANQARYWLASQQISQKEYTSAFETLASVQPQSTQFPGAVNLARFAIRKQLVETEDKGLATRPLARKSLQRWEDVFSSCDLSVRPLVAVAMAELGMGWRAEDSKMSGQRLKALASEPSAESNAEFLYQLAMISKPSEAKQLVEKGNALPFNVSPVRQSLLLIERLPKSKRLGEVKLAIVEDALTEELDKKTKDQFLISRCSALSMVGKRNEAIALFAELAAKSPKNLAVRQGWARIADDNEALGLWRWIAARTEPYSPAWFEAKFFVADLLHRSGKSDEAAKMLKYIQAVPPGWDNSELKSDFEELLRECQR